MLKLSEAEARKISGQLNYRHNGLIQVVTQEITDGVVLMVAHANREAVERSLTSGMMHYWSKERGQLWMKGETSGHHQILEEVYIDCDADALLARVRQIDGACHLGYRACFFRQVKDGVLKEAEVERWETSEGE